MNDEQNEIPEFDEIGLTDTQTRFFSDHEDKIKRYWAESDLENLSKEANFFLNQFKNSLWKNNELKEINKYLSQRIDQEQSSKKEEIAKHAHRDYLFFNALKSIYRMCDRTAGEEIRASLELNDRTGKQGQMKKLMAEMERLSA